MPAAIPKSGWHELVDAIPFVTPTTLNALLTEAPEPVLVSFQAPGWEVLTPASHELVDIFGARLRVVHVDLTTYPELAVRFKIRVIPTLLLFTHGVLTEFIVGMLPTRFLIKALSTALGVRVNLNTAGGCSLQACSEGVAQVTCRRALLVAGLDAGYMVNEEHDTNCQADAPSLQSRGVRHEGRKQMASLLERKS